ncbi:MAG TPA: response regulator [Usitatibacteraceae bacterium]|nr:response regulator [Usitatibacteraceae bacterium]HQY46908.1 response regulator [Usitatibacteraceae bacterium]HRA24194.1 response regulator [Usitatibacteraceae bacterium]
MSPPANPTDEDELDFTREPAAPAPAPTPAQAADARAEAKTGTPQLEKSGFYVSIARRSPLMVPPRNGEKYSLLVVEDDPDLAQLVIDIFMTAGFEMHWASNKTEINQQMNRRPGVDLVLMDIVLPDANGLEVLQRIRMHPKLAKLPVIMMTGRSSAEDVAAGLVAGADGYVSKPFQMSGLVKAVQQVLGLK